MEDRRFEGVLKIVSKEKGFGFIECDETRAHFKRDIFVSISRLPDAIDRVGDKVSFVLGLGKLGYAEATSCKAV